MRRIVAVLAAVAVLSTTATTVLVWQLARRHAPEHPEVSAYTNGQWVRVGPYRYCDVVELTHCDIARTTGELDVSSRDPVQLSVPPSIARAPWVLLRAFEGTDAPLVEEFRPDDRRAVTVPTVDPRYGRLTGLAVQLPTLVRDEAGNEFPLPHAEWSVRTVWS